MTSATDRGHQGRSSARVIKGQQLFVCACAEPVGTKTRCSPTRPVESVHSGFDRGWFKEYDEALSTSLQVILARWIFASPHCRSRLPLRRSPDTRWGVEQTRRRMFDRQFMRQPIKIMWSTRIRRRCTRSARMKALQDGGPPTCWPAACSRRGRRTTRRAYSSAGSRRGKPSFDAAADGVVFGYAGVVILKRLSDALADGDNILSVIRGSGLSSDGRSPSINVPRADGQAIAIKRAYERAHIHVDTIQYVEAHATATPVGDAVEFDALRQALSDRDPELPAIQLGSVKALVGHTGWAAGVASVIKLCKAFEARVIPPQYHYTAPSGAIDLANSPFAITPSSCPWPENIDAQPRRAGINSFGFGGTNAWSLKRSIGLSPAAACLADTCQSSPENPRDRRHREFVSARDDTGWEQSLAGESSSASRCGYPPENAAPGRDRAWMRASIWWAGRRGGLCHDARFPGTAKEQDRYRAGSGSQDRARHRSQ